MFSLQTMTASLIHSAYLQHEHTYFVLRHYALWHKSKEAFLGWTTALFQSENRNSDLIGEGISRPYTDHWCPPQSCILAMIHFAEAISIVALRMTTLLSLRAQLAQARVARLAAIHHSSHNFILLGIIKAVKIRASKHGQLR